MPSQLDIQYPVEPRRFGPRSPSPLPSPRIPLRQELPPVDSGVEDTSLSFHDFEQPSLDECSASPLPRSKRQTFGPFTLESTPKVTNGATAPFSNIEPLSIKKKSSTRSTQRSHTPPRKHRTSPLSKMTGKVISPRKMSPQTSIPRPPISHHNTECLENVLQMVVSARDEVRPVLVFTVAGLLTAELDRVITPCSEKDET